GRDAVQEDHAPAPETLASDGAHPPDGARLRGVRRRLRTWGAELPRAGRRGLHVAARQPELRRRHRLRRPDHDRLAGSDRRLPPGAPRQAGTAPVTAWTPRRLLFGAGIATLCAWVLLPVYLVALGAFGGRSAVFRWPKTLWPTDLSVQAMLTFLQVEGVLR